MSVIFRFSYKRRLLGAKWLLTEKLKTIEAPVYMCVYTHIHTHTNIYIYTHKQSENLEIKISYLG